MAGDYKRGYSKGYSTGNARGEKIAQTYREQAQQAAMRAERAESEQGIGRCEECAHWQRGGGCIGWETCAWGHCNAPRGAGTPHGTWMVSDSTIQTTPKFGCVLFEAKPS